MYILFLYVSQMLDLIITIWIKLDGPYEDVDIV